MIGAARPRPAALREPRRRCSAPADEVATAPAAAPPVAAAPIRVEARLSTAAPAAQPPLADAAPARVEAAGCDVRPATTGSATLAPPMK
jgi:hypothetical protein